MQKITEIDASRLRAMNFSLGMCWSTYLTMDLTKLKQLKQKLNEVDTEKDIVTAKGIQILIDTLEGDLTNSKLFESPIAYDA